MTFRVTQPDAAYRLNVIGVSGEGKSHLRNVFLGPIRRVTLANPLEDLDLGWIVTTDEYGAMVEDIRRGALRVTVKPTSYDPQIMLEEFDALCGYVYEVGAQHFAVEEGSLYRGEDALRVAPNLNRLAIAGRHRGVSLSVYGQRFHQFPLIIRGQSTEIIAFRQSDPDDVRDFEKRISPDFSPLPINQLPQRHFIRWRPEVGAQYCSPLSGGCVFPLLNNRSMEDHRESEATND